MTKPPEDLWNYLDHKFADIKSDLLDIKTDFKEITTRLNTKKAQIAVLGVEIEATRREVVELKKNSTTSQLSCRTGSMPYQCLYA